MSFCPSCKQSHDKAATRAHILDVASRLFHLNGYDGIVLRDIAAESGCSTGAIFAHWKSKDELFAEAMGRPHLTDAHAAELLAALKEAAPARADELLNGWAA